MSDMLVDSKFEAKNTLKIEKDLEKLVSDIISESNIKKEDSIYLLEGKIWKALQ